MSEDTARALQAAIQEQARLKGEADALEQQFLDDVARELPTRVDELAKRIGHSQPEVIKGLGADGVKALRRELADASADLAKVVAGAITVISWPQNDSAYSSASTNSIRLAVMRFLSGKHVYAIAAVFKRHGFNIQDGGTHGSQGLVAAYSLFDEKALAPIADALNAAWQAERVTARAKKDDDHDTVDSLWQD